MSSATSSAIAAASRIRERTSETAPPTSFSGCAEDDDADQSPAGEWRDREAGEREAVGAGSAFGASTRGDAAGEVDERGVVGGRPESTIGERLAGAAAVTPVSTSTARRRR